MKWSVSQLKNWLNCQTYCYYHDVLRRGISGVGSATLLGTVFHEFMEAKLKGLPEPEITFNEMDAQGMKAAGEWKKLLPFAQAWEAPKDWEVRGVERAFEWPLGLNTLQGRLDALIWWNDGYWSLQWKTCGQSTNLETFGEHIRIGFHECAYQWLCEQAGFKPFKGTILVTAKRLSQKAIGEGRAPIAPPQYLFRSGEMVAERVEQMKLKAEEMSHIIDGITTFENGHLARTMKKLLFKNVEQCRGMFHNSKCPYWDVCHEGASIDSAPFIDLPDRYESEQEEE